jgi:hypothetical protein
LVVVLIVVINTTMKPETQEKILELIDGGELSTSEISGRLGLNNWGTKQQLEDWEKENPPKVVSRKDGNRTYWKIFKKEDSKKK